MDLYINITNITESIKTLLYQYRLYQNKETLAEMKQNLKVLEERGWKQI